ncbi:MAG: MBL fold metallo-hydrolase [Deltaproteobacteria bacterium]|nr:MBL fold metallo-hydrolase [Deltaproteobacteria bacterium]
MKRRDVVVGASALLAASSTSSLLSSCAHEPVKYATRTERFDSDGIFHVGNSTHLIVLGGVHVLTDPWLKDPADKILKHRVAPAALPVDVDVLLLTHEHEDHFDVEALALIKKDCVVVVPTWLEARTKALGFTNVRPVKAGDVLKDVGGLAAVDVVRALHDCDEVVYRFSAGGRRVFFGGDTMPTNEIAALATAKADGGCDFAILPADAGALMGTRRVMNVDEAVAMGRSFGVDAAGKGAMLSHHEFELTSAVWNLIVDVKPVDTARLPAWFSAPTPGQRLLFPWSAP